MFKDNIEVNKTIKPNSAKLQELKYKLPEYFTANGEFNIEKLKSDLKENNINELSSGFRLDFIGKDYAKNNPEKDQLVLLSQIKNIILL